MTASPSLEQLAILLGDSDEEQRRSAVLELKRFVPAARRNLLMKALGDPVWRVRKEATGVLLAGGPDPELIRMLVGALGDASNAGLRNAAVEILAGFGSVVIPALVSSLRQVDGDTRKFIVDVLGLIGDGAARTALELALEDPDINVATAAAEGLGTLAAPEALPALIKALDRPALWFRYALLEAIAAIGSPVAVPIVSSYGEDRLLRRAVFDCLGRIGDVRSVPFLLAGVGERAPRLTMAAAKALARVRRRLAGVDREEVDRGLRGLAGTDLPVRLGKLAVESDDGRDAVVELLGVIGDPRSTGTLVHISKDELLKPLCVEAIRKMGDAVMPFLAGLFAQGCAEDRAGIMSLCGEVCHTGATGLLARGMADDSAPVRSAAIAAAVSCDAPLLMAAIVSCSTDRSPEVREEACLALACLAERHPDCALPVAEELAVSPDAGQRMLAARLCASAGDAARLEHLLRDEHPGVRSMAVSGLEKIVPVAAAAHLAVLLMDEAPEVRTAAAGVMGRVGGDAVFEPLLLALRDADPEVVCAAVRSLAGQGERAFAPVLDCSRQYGGLVLLAALESLGRIDSLRATEVLVERLADDDGEIVATVLRLLAEQGNTSWLHRYGGPLRYHPHWEVRSLVAAALGTLPAEQGRPLLAEMLHREDDTFVLHRIREALEGRC